MKKYNAVLFDLDGTLLDSTKGVISSVKYVVDKFSLPKVTEQTLKTFIGPPIQQSLIRVFGMTMEGAQTASLVFRNRYKNHDLLSAELYPDILRLLQTLKEYNIKIAVATYKREDYAIELLEHFGIARFTDYIFGADNENRLLKQDIINKCIESIGFDKKDYVMIGDSKFDAIGAEKAGIDFIGVTYGFGFTSKVDVKLFKNVGCTNNVAELAGLLL